MIITVLVEENLNLVLRDKLWIPLFVCTPERSKFTFELFHMYGKLSLNILI